MFKYGQKTSVLILPASSSIESCDNFRTVLSFREIEIEFCEIVFHLELWIVNVVLLCAHVESLYIRAPFQHQRRRNREEKKKQLDTKLFTCGGFTRRFFRRFISIFLLQQVSQFDIIIFRWNTRFGVGYIWYMVRVSKSTYNVSENRDLGLLLLG